MIENIMNNSIVSNKTVINSVVSRVVLREHLFGLDSMNESGDWDLARAYALGGKHLLSESARHRGKLLMESLFARFASVMQNLGQKISGGIDATKEMSNDLKERAGQVLVALFDEMPSGRELFEIIKTYSKKAMEAVKDAVAAKFEELKESLAEIKDDLISRLFSKDILEDGLIQIIKDAAKDAGQTILDWVDKIKNSPKEAIKMLKGGIGREQIANFAGKMFEIILQKSKKALETVKDMFLRVKGISNAKTAPLTVALFKLATGDLSDTDQIIETAQQLWGGAQRVSSKRTIYFERSKEFTSQLAAFLPEAIKSLVKGDNPMETLARAVGGDPTKIIKHALGLGIAALKKVAEKGIDKAMISVGIQENGKIWKTIRAATLALLGAATKNISESRRRFRKNRNFYYI